MSTTKDTIHFSFNFFLTCLEKIELRYPNFARLKLWSKSYDKMYFCCFESSKWVKK